MGGVFSAPKTSAPAVVENNDTEKLAEEERQKALERQRRGVVPRLAKLGIRMQAG